MYGTMTCNCTNSAYITVHAMHNMECITLTRCICKMYRLYHSLLHKNTNINTNHICPA